MQDHLQRQHWRCIQILAIASKYPVLIAWYVTDTQSPRISKNLEESHVTQWWPQDTHLTRPKNLQRISKESPKNLQRISKESPKNKFKNGKGSHADCSEWWKISPLTWYSISSTTLSSLNDMKSRARLMVSWPIILIGTAWIQVKMNWCITPNNPKPSSHNSITEYRLRPAKLHAISLRCNVISAPLLSIELFDRLIHQIDNTSWWYQLFFLRLNSLAVLFTDKSIGVGIGVIHLRQFKSAAIKSASLDPIHFTCSCSRNVLSNIFFCLKKRNIFFLRLPTIGAGEQLVSDQTFTWQIEAIVKW